MAGSSDLIRRMVALEQTTREQQTILENIQQMMRQLMARSNSTDEVPRRFDSKKGVSEKPVVDAEVLKRLEAKLAFLSLSQRDLDELKKVRFVLPYPPEWKEGPCPPNFVPPTMDMYDGTGLADQHIYHFLAHCGQLIGNDAVMTRMFSATLVGVAWEWFIRLPEGSITSWWDLETRFLSAFYMPPWLP